MKNCSICLLFLPLSSFDKQSTGKLGCRADCKICRKRFLQSRDGLVKSIYHNQILKSKRRNYSPPSYTERELSTWIFNQVNFEALYLVWVNSNYSSKLKPSIDRLNDYKSYSFSNIRLVTWEENSDKYQYDKKEGINTKTSLAVDMFDLNGVFIQRFNSVSEAARLFKGVPSNIIGAINQRKSTRNGRQTICLSAYKHLWKYSTIPNTKEEVS